MSPHHLQGSFLLFHFFHMPLSPLPTPHRRPLASLWAFFRSSAQELTQRSCSAPRRLLWRCGRGGTTKSGSNFDGGARLFLFSSRLALRLPLHRPRQQLFLPAPTLPLLVPNLATSEGRGGAGFLSALPCCLSSLPFSFFLLRRGGDVEHGAQSVSRGGAKMVASSEPEFWVGARARPRRLSRARRRLAAVPSASPPFLDPPPPPRGVSFRSHGALDGARLAMGWCGVASSSPR